MDGWLVLLSFGLLLAVEEFANIMNFSIEEFFAYWYDNALLLPWFNASKRPLLQLSDILQRQRHTSTAVRFQ